jgi:hypothetical protein
MRHLTHRQFSRRLKQFHSRYHHHVHRPPASISPTSQPLSPPPTGFHLSNSTNVPQQLEGINLLQHPLARFVGVWGDSIGLLTSTLFMFSRFDKKRKLTSHTREFFALYYSSRNRLTSLSRDYLLKIVTRRSHVRVQNKFVHD